MVGVIRFIPKKVNINDVAWINLDEGQYANINESTDILFSIAPKSDIGFYSPTEEALLKISQNKGTAEQFRTMLLNNGAKQAEMEWMGWDERFGKTDKLTKADIQNWIDENKIEVEEVEKGQENSDIRYEYSDELTENSAERKSELEDAINEYEKLDRLDLQGDEHFDKYDEISNKYNVESQKDAESELEN